jgi:3-oxoacyl-[acyl-carrier protein] reductase
VNIAGSVAVITGGARGIGLAVARSLAADGAKVVLGDVLEEDLYRSVRDIRATGGEATAVRADVTRDEDVEKLILLQKRPPLQLEEGAGNQPSGLR